MRTTTGRARPRWRRPRSRYRGTTNRPAVFVFEGPRLTAGTGRMGEASWGRVDRYRSSLWSQSSPGFVTVSRTWMLAARDVGDDAPVEHLDPARQARRDITVVGD